MHIGRDAENSRLVARGRVDTESALAAGHHQTHVRLGLAVGAYRLEHDLANPVQAAGQLEGKRFRPGREPRQMIVEPEYVAAENADALEDTIAIQQAMIGDR